MRTTLLLTTITIAFAVTTNTAKAQCADIFISEYAEGANNNKAIELYNPTPNAINLGNKYRLVRYNNGTSAAAGEANAQASINLGTHTIPAYGTWVIVIDKRDPNGTGQEIAVDAALQAKADTFLCPDYNISYAMYFNGNDAVSLQKQASSGANWEYVDIFAKMGDAAMTTSNGWSDQFPYDGSAGEIWTLNHTLVRKHTVKTGVMVNPTTFNVTVEYDSLPNNTWTGLGSHTCDCFTSSVNSNDKNFGQVKLYPNPSSNNYFNVSATEAINLVQVYNTLGQLVLEEKAANNEKAMKVTSENLNKGTYIVKVKFNNEHTVSTLLILH